MFTIRFPCQDLCVNLPNNRYQARQRLLHLKKNDKLKEHCIKFMKDTIAKGYARKSTTEVASGKAWYLLHLGVFHPNKPGKIRVVQAQYRISIWVEI